MALSGWGLTPGTLEKNVTRSLGGKYGAVGNSPTTVSGMMRDKYSAGLQAKSAKEQFDFAKTSEENRKAESARDFGLTSEKFGYQKERDAQDFGFEQEKFALTQTQAAQAWDMAQRQYELDKLKVSNSTEQAALDRALEQKKLEISSAYNNTQLAQKGSQFDQELAQRGSEYDQNLGLQNRELESLDAYRKRQMDAQGNSEADAIAFRDQKYRDEQKLLQQQQQYAKTPTYSSGGTGGDSYSRQPGSAGYKLNIGRNGQPIWTDMATGQTVSQKVATGR